jgi:hypothetical protein
VPFCLLKHSVNARISRERPQQPALKRILLNVKICRVFVPLTAALLLSSCAKQEAPAPVATETPASSQPATPTGPRAVVILKNGSKVPGTVVASSATEMIVAGDNGVETKIPLAQIKSVDYADTAAAPPVSAAREAAPKMLPKPAAERPSAERPAAVTPAPAPPVVTTRTYVLPAGTDVSVRTNEPIDSDKAAEGQAFDAQVTRNATDANGDVVIPRGADAKVVIRSASKGGRFRGASDLVLDLQSVRINGKAYELDTADVTKTGKSGVGANKRTATYTGGGAAVGAIIGAIAGGGKGAAIGAGAGAGAGALTQILTKGGAIKVPVESVLTFQLDQPLRVTAKE